MATNPLASKQGICITNLGKVEFDENKHSTHKIRLLLASKLRMQQKGGLTVQGETSAALGQTQEQAVKR